MSATQEQIEKLKTLQESYDVVATAVETQLPAIADKIDNLHVDVDTTELAKESTLLLESESIKQAIVNAKPNINLEGVATELTLTEKASEIITLINQVSDAQASINNVLSTSAQEATLLAESAAIKEKIDTSDLAKESTLQYIKNVIIENEEDITFIAASNEEINNELDIIWNELWNQ